MAILGMVLVTLSEPVPTLAQPTEAAERTADACSASLESQRQILAALAADLQNDGMSQRSLEDLLAFRNSFQITIRQTGLTDVIAPGAVGIGTSVLASIALGGPPGWAAAALGAVLGVAYTTATDVINNVGNWEQIDANTAFFQFVLDYAEYGRVNVVDDSVATFASRYSSLLTRLTGSPPPSDPALLSRYLQANASALLLYFGSFEEQLGAAAFPRFRFPETAGRYGPSRLSVGYYSRVLGAELAEELRRLDAEIAALEANNCRPATVASVCYLPDDGGTARCYCDMAEPVGTVWGTDLYTDDSPICTAAVHAGLVRPAATSEGIRYIGVIDVRRAAGCPYYTPSRSFGVSTSRYGGWGGSFFFPEVQRGFCDEASVPEAGLWYCPHVLGGDATDLTCHCTPAAIELGPIWGTQVYTDDSAICRAARHDGAVGGFGGSVRVIRLGGLDEYAGTEANGIQSSRYGPWPRSIGFP
ncbi:MAG: hypothetical protein KIS68_04835 [Bauldia sp.]|nr:hypothetical protein [Bauldia sp.]